MGLETATLIHELDPANPVGASDPKSQGDDHLRLIKSAIQNTFANVDGAVTSSHTELNLLDGVTTSTAELNFVDGVTSAIQTQMDTKLATNGNGSALTNLNASALATGTVAAARLHTTVDSGTYTPTISGTVNLDANTPRVCQWMRIGNVVSVSGGINLDPTSNGIETQWQISLPVASDFAQVWQLAGSIGMDNQNNGFANGYIKANVANNTAEVHHFTQGLPAVEGRFHFQYLIV
jgi:hypothetical protein